MVSTVYTVYYDRDSIFPTKVNNESLLQCLISILIVNKQWQKVFSQIWSSIINPMVRCHCQTMKSLLINSLLYAYTMFIILETIADFIFVLPASNMICSNCIVIEINANKMQILFYRNTYLQMPGCLIKISSLHIT